MTQLNKSIPVAYHISSNKCQGEEGGSYLVSKAIGQKKTKRTDYALKGTLQAHGDR